MAFFRRDGGKIGLIFLFYSQILCFFERFGFSTEKLGLENVVTQRGYTAGQLLALIENKRS
jgi:hypothetical protein